MKLAPRSIRFFALAACLALNGCSAATSTDKTLPQQTQAPASPAAAKGGVTAKTDETAANAMNGSCPDARTVLDSERNRANCYHLRPAGTGSLAKKKPAAAQGRKATAKKGQKTPGKSKTVQAKGKQPPGRAAVAVKEKEEPQSSGLCQPQSLIYARCRTGIMTCRLGNTSPVQWFACAKSMKNTTATPVAGSVLVLDVNCRRGMPTGHPAYVEEVKQNGNGTWTLRISHTNYDRKCHLDQDATVLFDPKTMTAHFRTGPWAPWANDLKALGFILR